MAAPIADPAPPIADPAPLSELRDVYAGNLVDSFELLETLAIQYPLIAIDLEFSDRLDERRISPGYCVAAYDAISRFVTGVLIGENGFLYMLAKFSPYSTFRWLKLTVEKLFKKFANPRRKTFSDGSEKEARRDLWEISFSYNLQKLMYSITRFNYISTLVQ
ncbi:hypothetical protein POM88_020642 [Heracleum sosnowskyi]|uniref:Uncharacterized protein n=1 Tax=Heracleum sosnowskyi TaxID=360622 RepID=A0AAD8MS32_9APIA|nr:hypothetical protein POM88_020642 [Heracleum sosnowskyi]